MSQATAYGRKSKFFKFSVKGFIYKTQKVATTSVKLTATPYSILFDFMFT